MMLASQGSQVTLTYDKPRQGLGDIGISSGTVLFTGTRTGNYWEGEAATFSRRCGEVKFPVTGATSDGGKLLELRGKRPSRESSCRVTGNSEELLVFELVSTARR